ncbi:MAG: tyrosinase family protein [Thaumarchaeota archaeon]|nr:tyrosinase family protein [Nitrososphaerota archaeon]
MCADIIRRNLKTLSDSEKQDFIDAVWALKRNGKYDLYVRWHAIAMNQGAHGGPAFLPWHREYLRRFERDLQDEIPDIGLPYWDWSTDGDTANPTQSSIWNDDLLGGDGDSTNDNLVTSGPFLFDRNDLDNSWLIVNGNGDPVGGLQRNLGKSIFNVGDDPPTLPISSDVQNVSSITPYDSEPWNMREISPSFRRTLELIHNSIHVWVGGSMLASTSPNDPVFFLHHCFVEKLWEEWQKRYVSEDYVPESGAERGHNAEDQMIPWHVGITPRSIVDYNLLEYKYDTD